MCYNAYILYACGHQTRQSFLFIQCDPGHCRGVQTRLEPQRVPQRCPECAQSRPASARHNSINEHARYRNHESSQQRRRSSVEYLRSSTSRRESRRGERESRGDRHRDPSYERTRTHAREMSPTSERSCLARLRTYRNAAAIHNAFSERSRDGSCGSEASYAWSRGWGY